MARRWPDSTSVLTAAAARSASPVCLVTASADQPERTAHAMESCAFETPGLCRPGALALARGRECTRWLPVLEVACHRSRTHARVHAAVRYARGHRYGR